MSKGGDQLESEIAHLYLARHNVWLWWRGEGSGGIWCGAQPQQHLQCVKMAATHSSPALDPPLLPLSIQSHRFRILTPVRVIGVNAVVNIKLGCVVKCIARAEKRRKY